MFFIVDLLSRFLGFELKLPLPNHALGSFAVGDLISTSNMDFENKTKTLKGTERYIKICNAIIKNNINLIENCSKIGK